MPAKESVLKSIVIFSSGRSGSNRLLDVFDVHQQTLCRNEVDGVDALFKALPSPLFEKDLPSDFADKWNEVMHRTRRRNSGRDRFTETDKIFFRPSLARLGQKVMSKKRLRALLPRYAGEGWDIPYLWFLKSAEEQVIPVVKIGHKTSWMLRTQPVCAGQYIIHNVRHPVGVINSWWNRYVIGRSGDPEAVFRNTVRLSGPIISEYYGHSLDRLQKYSVDALLEAELWLWRYRNEPVYQAFKDSERYHLVRYEDGLADPVGQAQTLFESVGLTFHETHATRVAALENTLFSRPHRDRLDEARISAAVKRVLGDSELYGMMQAA